MGGPSSAPKHQQLTLELELNDEELATSVASSSLEKRETYDSRTSLIFSSLRPIKRGQMIIDGSDVKIDDSARPKTKIYLS